MNKLLAVIIVLIQVAVMTIDWWDGELSRMVPFYLGSALCATFILHNERAT